jgi:CheY-like chemotaxis protein
MSAPRRVQSVLIVDDDESLRATIRDYAERLGIDVWEAPNGLEAVWILEHQRPALVLLDLKMPRLDGFETLRQIRHIDASMRVVLVTGDPDDAARRRLAALELEVLYKPITPAELDRVFGAPAAHQSQKA